MSWRATAAALLALAPLGAPPDAGAQQAVQQAPPPAAETVWIPTTETGALGGTREIRLEIFLYRPAAPGPFPLLLLNHGSTGAGRVSPTATVFFKYPEIARFFVERGWAVLIPMRRGWGASGGEYLERYDCDRGILLGGVDRGIADVDAALAYVAAQP